MLAGTDSPCLLELTGLFIQQALILQGQASLHTWGALQEERVDSSP